MSSRNEVTSCWSESARTKLSRLSAQKPTGSSSVGVSRFKDGGVILFRLRFCRYKLAPERMKATTEDRMNPIKTFVCQFKDFSVWINDFIHLFQLRLDRQRISWYHCTMQYGYPSKASCIWVAEEMQANIRSSMRRIWPRLDILAIHDFAGLETWGVNDTSLIVLDIVQSFAKLVSPWVHSR